MSNTKHTPGPWSISSACKNAINAERNNKLIGIGTTYHDPDSVYFIGQDEAIANARLIAAAPELLEALKSAASLANELALAKLFPGTVLNDDKVNELLDKYREIIAKATQP